MDVSECRAAACARELARRWCRPVSIGAAAALALGMPVVRAQPAWSPHRYNQLYRPQVHFSPLRHWMNDPNGLVYFDGWYHLFFQYNPYGSRWGHMSWGHARSRDLLHWQALPVAIPESRRFMIFSGSAVVDWHDTSGFGVGRRPPLVAIYTAEPRGHRGPQTQNLAYSTDGGLHWKKYAGNPVLNIGLKNFRDPKVFWYAPQHEWVMVVSRAAARRISFYTSHDLKTWHRTGGFGPAGDTRGVWECPDLFELPVENRPGQSRWVLKVDAQQHRPDRGGGGQVFIGHFNGKTFDTSDLHSQQLDLGEDYYASASWSDLPASRSTVVALGWMNNWLYAQDIPTSTWRGAMAFPRRLSLRVRNGAYHLMQRPVAALAKLRRARRRLAGFMAPHGRMLLSVPPRGDAHEIRALIRVGRRGAFVFSIGSSDGKLVKIRYEAASERFSVSRTGHYRFSKVFDSHNAAVLSSVNGAIELDLIIDRSSVEAFVNDGALTVAERMFPSGGAYTVTVRSNHARIEQMDIWDLRSIWRGSRPRSQ